MSICNCITLYHCCLQGGKKNIGNNCLLDVDFILCDSCLDFSGICFMSLWGSDRRSAQRHQVGIHHKLLTVSHKKHSRMRAMLVVAITHHYPRQDDGNDMISLLWWFLSLSLAIFCVMHFLTTSSHGRFACGCKDRSQMSRGLGHSSVPQTWQGRILWMNRNQWNHHVWSRDSPVTTTIGKPAALARPICDCLGFQYEYKWPAIHILHANLDFWGPREELCV